jgi:adenylylsulfate kinase-like enzyme
MVTVSRACRRLVYVSGAPGSGKTSLAIPLAAELGYTLLAKDRIKETLHEALGAPESDLAWSRRLGGAVMELLWALAADAPDVVIEANFRPHSEYEKAKLSGLAAHPVEVYCACPPELPSPWTRPFRSTCLPSPRPSAPGAGDVDDPDRRLSVGAGA